MNSPTTREKTEKKAPFDLFEQIEVLAFAVITVVVLFLFIGRPVYVSGTSMLPTLYDRDSLIITKLGSAPTQGDIVVITKPNTRGEPIIKRIIATEGQTVDIDFTCGKIYVDGNLLQEDYIQLDSLPMRSGEIQFPMTVEKGNVFVLGDNRNHSLDSRFEEVGQVDTRYILGKVAFKLFSRD